MVNGPLRISIGDHVFVDADYDELECSQNASGEITLTAHSPQLAADAEARRIDLLG